MHFLRRTGIVAAIVGAAALTAQARTIHDAAADFSAVNNPNGVWSFGYATPTPSHPFVLSTFSGIYAGFDYWAADPTTITPGAYHNPTNSTIFFGGSANIHPGELNMHPGPLGEYSITRFTAPSAGLYAFSASFIGEDLVIGTSTDVHLLVNSAPLFSGLVNGYHATAASGPFIMSLQAGDTIDAAVGWGNNGDFYGDQTGIDFKVERVPAPGAAAMLGIGGLLAARRRR